MIPMWNVDRWTWREYLVWNVGAAIVWLTCEWLLS